MLVDTTFIVHYLFSPCSADDISSDFTLRGINVQCIHGDRYSIINLQHVWLINVCNSHGVNGEALQVHPAGVIAWAGATRYSSKHNVL